MQGWQRIGWSALAIAALSSASLPMVAIAQVVRFNVPDLEAPGNRESAAQRSGDQACLGGTTPLMAVMPETNIGLATAAYPEFYVFVPPTKADTAQFVVFDGATNEVFYQETYSLKDHNGGIVTLPLPDNGIQAPLEVGQEYYWYFSVICDADNPDTNPVIESAIKRIAPDSSLEQAAAAVPLASRPQLYATEGLWFDALSSSAQLGTATDSGVERPSDQWRSLLESVGLEAIASAPLLQP